LTAKRTQKLPFCTFDQLLERIDREKPKTSSQVLMPGKLCPKTRPYSTMPSTQRQHSKSCLPIPKSQRSNTFKPQTKKATQNTKIGGGKSQLSRRQKSQQKFFS
jgi:hypothetical protein